MEEDSYAMDSTRVFIFRRGLGHRSFLTNDVREAPTNQNPRLFGGCPFGGRGGGLNPYQDGLGHLFRGKLSKFKCAFA